MSIYLRVLQLGWDINIAINLFASICAKFFMLFKTSLGM